jgi:hypothetical protein
VQAVAQMLFKRWAVQERVEEVDPGEVKVDEMFDQVWLWKGVTGRIEAERSAFPLFLFRKKKLELAGQRAQRSGVSGTPTECWFQNSGRRLAKVKRS